MVLVVVVNKKKTLVLSLRKVVFTQVSFVQPGSSFFFLWGNLVVRMSWPNHDVPLWIISRSMFLLAWQSYVYKAPIITDDFSPHWQVTVHTKIFGE